MEHVGNRLSKTVNESDTTLYVNDTTTDLTQVAAETDENGNETDYYTRGDELLSMEKAGEVCYYLYDGHGNVRTLTNEAGRITDRYSYDAYGSLLEKEGDTENEFLYTGEQYNANTGLYYLRARYMNPSTGIFISMDSYRGSIYDPVSLHKYLYANANPVRYSDPSGYEASRLDEQVVCLGIATILASAILFSQSAALNMFASLRVNMVDSVIGLGDIYVTPRDWKDVFITFPSRNFDRQYIISTPMYLMNRHLFMPIYAIEREIHTLIPGIPAKPKDEPKIYDDNSNNNIANDSNTNETPIYNGNSRPWNSDATPNSIYEQLNPDGTVKSRSFYDENGREFNRQDFDHEHFDKKTQQYYQPHEHRYHYNKNGYRDGVWDGPLTPGYNNLMTQ